MDNVFSAAGDLADDIKGGADHLLGNSTKKAGN